MTHCHLSNLDILSPALATLFDSANQFLLLAGSSGSPLEIGYQAERIRDLIGGSGEILDGDSALRKYEQLRDLDFYSTPFAAQIAVPPASRTSPGSLRCRISRPHQLRRLAQIVTTQEPSAEAAVKVVARWREVARSAHGNLRLLAASPDIRDSLEIFDTPNDSALALMRRMKGTFDPANIFNPGCFVGAL